MTAVVKPPRPFVADGSSATVAPDVAGAHSVAQQAYVGRHRDERRAHHRHAAAAMLALMLAWIPAAAAGRGRHRRG